MEVPQGGVFRVFRGGEYREEVGLIFGAAHEAGGEGAMAAQGIEADAVGTAGYVDALEGFMDSVGGAGSTVAGGDFGPGGEGHGELFEEDEVLTLRGCFGPGNIRCEEPPGYVFFVHQGAGDHAEFDWAAALVGGEGAPQGGGEVFEGAFAGFFDEGGLGEYLIEIDFEGGFDSGIQENGPEGGKGFEEAVVAAVFAVDAEGGAEGVFIAGVGKPGDEEIENGGGVGFGEGVCLDAVETAGGCGGESGFKPGTGLGMESFMGYGYG